MRHGWESASTRLVAALGHELRNPLAAAVAGISAAAAMTDPSDPRHEFLRRGVDDLARVSDLLKQYLEFGRGAAMRKAPLDLRAQVVEIAGRATAPVVTDLPDAPVTVRGNAALLGRVVENLIANAARAGASEIVVRLRCDDDTVTLEVRDDGPGVDPKMRDAIFAPFVSGSGGSGIGLALAADVVEAHGGRIELLPAVRGARFAITLPLTLPQEAARPAALSRGA